jgi:hypothetical protein
VYRSLALALLYGRNVRVFFVGSVQPGNSLAALPSSKVDDGPEKIWGFEHDGIHVPVLLKFELVCSDETGHVLGEVGGGGELSHV